MNRIFRGLVQTRSVREADWILVTGDVTDRGRARSWEVFWDALTAAGVRDRTLVVPGNHDVSNLGIRPPARKKDRIAADLERARRGLDRGGQPTRFPWARKVEARVVLFGLDSSNPGNLSGVTNAVGEIGLRQLEALARLLGRYREAPVKIVALHHSPNIPQNRTARKRGLPTLSKMTRWGHEVPAFDRRALRLLCLTHRVRLIVHGHLHRVEDRRVQGVRIIGGPASTETHRGVCRFFEYSVLGTGGRVVPRLVSVTVTP